MSKNKSNEFGQRQMSNSLLKKKIGSLNASIMSESEGKNDSRKINAFEYEKNVYKNELKIRDEMQKRLVEKKNNPAS